MSTNATALRPGCRASFQDGPGGSLTGLEVADDWEVLNAVIVSRGLLRSASVKLPLAAASAWNDEGIRFDGLTAARAYAREVAPVAAPARPLSTKTPIALPATRLAGALVSTRDRRATALLLAHGVGSRRLVRVDVGDVSFDGKTIVVAVQPDVLPDYRSDEDLRRLTRKALAQCRWLTTDELRAITVDVDAGRVRLSGNVLAKSGKDAALAAAQAAVGDTLVNCDIIDDLSLETGIGLALHIAGLQRGAAIFTRATLGAVTLFGRAPSQPAVEETARTVERTPGVRSVSCRIEVRASPG